MKTGSWTAFPGTPKGVIAVGALIGLVGALLQYLGNPPNMGICVACFERDIAGALGLHRASVVQYLRPEIPAFVLGSFIAALLGGEFKARSGSAPVIRFVLGGFAMIGALAFLGCPWRAVLRLAAGDMNALVGLAGLTIGIAVGIWFLRRGYTLGRNHAAPAFAGLVFPLLAIGLLVLVLAAPDFLGASVKGPGSLHAAIPISIGAGLLVGFMAQRSRFCTMGAIRDSIMIRDSHLLRGVLAMLVAALVLNLVLGQFTPGLVGQKVSHSNHLWNLLGMILAGLCFSMAGGCPGRQVFLAGEGNGDSAVFVLGMLAGGGLAHNFFLAARPDKMAGGELQVLGGPGPNGQVAVLLGIAFCLVLGFAMRRRLD